MSRFLLIDTDGETIVATLTMNEADALANVGSGQSLVAIDPETDTGAHVDDGAVKWSSGDATLVLIADETPKSEFSGVTMTEVAEP